MKDDALDRVLRGLGRVEAPSGLEGRVLRRLEEPGSERTNGWGSGFRLAGGLALAMGVLAWCVGTLGRRQGDQTAGAKALIAGGTERPKAEALGYLQATGTPRQDREQTPRGVAKRPKAEALRYRQAKAKGAAAAHVSESRPEAPGLLAAFESFPAPPEPLTEQERLLLRVAHHPRAGEVEFLIAEVREAALIRSNAEFDLFFPTPPSVESTEISQPVEEKETNNGVQPKVR